MKQCSRKTFKVHQTSVQWTSYILFKFVKSLIRHLGLAIRNVWWFSWTLIKRSLSTCTSMVLWHIGTGKMATILQKTFSNAFSWNVEFGFKVHLYVFLRANKQEVSFGPVDGLALVWWYANTCISDDKVLWYYIMYMALLGLVELKVVTTISTESMSESYTKSMCLGIFRLDTHAISLVNGYLQDALEVLANYVIGVEVEGILQLHLLCTNWPNCKLTLLVLKPEYSVITWSIPWLLMPWLLMLSGHQQPWYWLCWIIRSLSSTKKNFNYMQKLNIEKW